jgi:NRPS condensation-like uncharacterized protein
LTDDEQLEDFWLRLDNAAKIYPAISGEEITSVMRISAELHERIKVKPFIQAVRTIEKRFPYFKVKLKKGFFWYYLEYQDLPSTVVAESGLPCRKFKKDELMYRILVKENKISVEFSHILTDGNGAFEFLRTLLVSYFEKCGYGLPDRSTFIDPNETHNKEEYEDAFNKYFIPASSRHVTVPDAFHLPFRLKPTPRFEVLLGIMPLDQVMNKAREKKVSLTEYLIAAYMYALQEVYYELPSKVKKNCNKTVRIEVPVNLRKMYPSKTMRNFTLYVLPEIELRQEGYTFDELVRVVYYQMKLETGTRRIDKIISRNVGGERNPFVRGVPLVFKTLILSFLYYQGASKYSGVITNLGKIDLSPDLNKLIKRFVFIPPPANKMIKVNCGVAGFDNNLVLSFGNISGSRDLERHFFSFLLNQGIPVKIENY